MDWLRNLARLLAVVVLAFLVWMLFGGLERPPAGYEWLGLVFFPIGVGVGLLLAFWRERPGALLALASLGAFYLQYRAIVGSFPPGPWFALLTSPALLFLIVGRRRVTAAAA